MVEYKASLKLNIPKDQNILGLSEETFSVTQCDYVLKRGTNREGEVSTGVKGGTITVTISDFPTDSVMSWVFDHMRKYNGEITIQDTEFETLEQIYFENARCVDFRMQYKTLKEPYTLTSLTIVASKIQIGNAHFENIGK